MLTKPRLIKKGTAETTVNPRSGANEKTELGQRVFITQKAIQTTKDWLMNHRQQQGSARQTFAALFINSDHSSMQSS